MVYRFGMAFLFVKQAVYNKEDERFERAQIR